jgi:Novel STAND NTPase 3/Trypsin-like peptidase domain
MKQQRNKDNEDIDALRCYVVRIVSNVGSEGAGIVVTDDGVIATCFHVIGNTHDGAVFKGLHVYFDKNVSKASHTAIVLNEFCDYKNDTAFLKLVKLPPLAKPCSLSENVIFGHKFASRGFRKSEIFESMTSYGQIRSIENDRTDNSITDTIAERPRIQLDVKDIDSGMSGGPVLDLETGKVIGIISNKWDNPDDIDRDLALAIPVASLIKTCPLLAKQNSGLVRINQFLEYVGLGNAFLFKKFDDIYVPPQEYYKIKQIIESKRCVFITGTPEYGKTYTAIYLLWQYWNRGIKCIHAKTLPEIDDIISRLRRDDTELSNTIVYMEDPTGKIEYQRNPQFEDSIVDVISSSLRALNSYLVVTMREDVYKKTRLNILHKNIIEDGEYIIHLQISNSSYDYPRRREILLRWATQKECAWLSDTKLADFIFSFVEQKKLPTLLNIYNFAAITGKDGTYAILADSGEMERVINEQSKSIPHILASQIFGMSMKKEFDKVLFVSIPFITGYRIVVERIQEDSYFELLRELNIEYQDKSIFRNLVKEFQDKLDLHNDFLSFVHPSYYEALPILLDNTESLENPFYKFFKSSLEKLGTTKKYTMLLGNFINENFDILPLELAENLWLEIIHDKYCYGLIGYGVGKNFNRLTLQTRDALLENLRNSRWAISSIIYGMAENYNDTKEELEKLLFFYAKFEYFIPYIAYAISLNFDKTKPKLKKLLFTLAQNDKTAAGVAEGLSMTIGLDFNIDLLTLLIPKLAKYPDAVHSITELISWDFDRMTPELKKLLYHLANNKKTAAAVASGLSVYRGSKARILNTLIPKLMKHDEALQYLCRVLQNDGFDEISPELLRTTLLTLAKNTKNLDELVYVIGNHKDKIESSLMQKLLKNKELKRLLTNMEAEQEKRRSKELKNLI